MNNDDDDKFPILVRRGDGQGLAPARAGGEWPAFAGGAPNVSASASTPTTPAGVSPGARSNALPPPAQSERASPSAGLPKVNGAGAGGAIGSGAVDALGDQFSNFSIDTKVFSPSSSGVDVSGVSSLSTPFLGGGGGGYVHDHGAFVYGGPAGGAGGRGEGMGANRFAGLRLEDLQGGAFQVPSRCGRPAPFELTLRAPSQTCCRSARTNLAAVTCRRSSRTATRSTAT